MLEQLLGRTRLAKRVAQRHVGFCGGSHAAWQLALAGLHLVSAVAVTIGVLVLTARSPGDPFVFLAYTYRFGDVEQGMRTSRPEMCGEACAWRVNLGAMLIAFGYVTAFSHAVQAALALPQAGDAVQYEAVAPDADAGADADAKRGGRKLLAPFARLMAANVNPLRWAEYAVTYPLMLAVFARLCGAAALFEVAAVAGLGLGTIACGFASEVALTPRTRRKGERSGAAAAAAFQTAGWLLMAVALGFPLARFWTAAANAPKWVYALVAGEVLFFCAFGVLALVHLCLVPPDLYGAVVQRGFDVLSLTAKLYLQWTLVGGVASAG